MSLHKIPDPNHTPHEANPLKPEYTSVDITIILIGTETNGNIGSVARAMKNFGFQKLILVNPEEDPFAYNVYGYAMHARDVLDNATLIKTPKYKEKEELRMIKKTLSQFDVVIGTSAKGVSYKNIKRIPVFLNELDLSNIDKNSKIALVFGRESTGLSNEELNIMDFLIRIPTNPDYPTMNLSHAVAVTLSHIYLEMHSISHSQIVPATKKDKDHLLDLIRRVVKRIPIPSYRNDRTFHAFRNLIGRSFLSKKEASLLFNFFNKTSLMLDDPLRFTEEAENATNLEEDNK
jgi:tRNA/rRNA methyltransferase